MGSTELCNSETDEETNAIRRKRSRRVSFAETTSVHVFDRDEDYETPPESRPDSDDHVPTVGAFPLFGGSTHVGDSKELPDDDNDSIEDDDVVDRRGTFLRPISSPSLGSATGSINSNDEDYMFGPVSASFIRVSDGATPDKNRDITMDSEAFSMHYRSLARSEEGGDGEISVGSDFNEKTPGNGRTPPGFGSSMVLTGGRKLKNDCPSPDDRAGSMYKSSTMSLVHQIPREFDFGKIPCILSEEGNGVSTIVGPPSPSLESGFPTNEQIRRTPPLHTQSVTVDLQVIRSSGNEGSVSERHESRLIPSHSYRDTIDFEEEEREMPESKTLAFSSPASPLQFLSTVPDGSVHGSIPVENFDNIASSASPPHVAVAVPLLRIHERDRLLDESLAVTLSDRDVDELEHRMGRLRRFGMLRCLASRVQNDTKRAVRVPPVLLAILYEKARSELLQLKRDRLSVHIIIIIIIIITMTIITAFIVSSLVQARVQHLAAERLECQILKTRLANSRDQKFQTDNGGAVEPNPDVELLNAKIERVAKAVSLPVPRLSLRSLRNCFRLWDIDVGGQRELILRYPANVSLRVEMGRVCSVVDEGGSMREHAAIDGHVAFSYVVDVGPTQGLSEAVQAVSLSLSVLLDVVREVQLARVDLKNLVTARFLKGGHGLYLELQFVDFRTGQIQAFNLDLSCLRLGIYPSHVVPMSAPSDELPPLPSEIKKAVQALPRGYFRITRLCKCISEAIRIG